MTEGPPAPVRRHLNRPLRWLAVLALVCAFGVFADWLAAKDDRRWARTALVATGEVLDRYRGGADVPVRYRNPLTNQELEVTIRVWDHDRLPDAGDEVPLDVSREDPGKVRLPGDRFPATVNLWGNVVILAFPFAALLLRRWTYRRTRNLVRTPSTSFAMLAAIAPPRWLGNRCHLQLYALDSAPGASPACSVPLISTGGAAIGTAVFPVEVKGIPRPLGRVVARADDRILWPAGRSQFTGGMPRPAAFAPGRPAEAAVAVSAPDRVPWHRSHGVPLVLLVGSLVILAVVAPVTLANARDAERLENDGVAVLARIERRDDLAASVLVSYRLPGDESTRRQAAAPVDDPSEHPIGRRYPAHVDRDDPSRIRLDREPYDRVEPIVWASFPAAVAGFVLGLRLLRARADERAAREGPWRHVRAWLLPRRLGVSFVALADSGSDHPRCAVRLGRSEELASWLVHVGPTDVLAAGPLEPGAPVAIVAEGRRVLVNGPARAPRRASLG